MRINRGLLNWGVFLIALGGIPLAVQQGFTDSGVVGDIWRLWPLILVGIGLGVLLRWTPLAWLGGVLVAGTFGLIFGALFAGGGIGIGGACGELGDDAVRSSQSGIASTTAFDVEVGLSCGELSITRDGGAEWSVAAMHEEDGAPTIAGDSDSLSVRQDGDDPEVFALGLESRNDWQVQLPAEPALSIDATLNAADSTIDLGGGLLGVVNGSFNLASASLSMADATTNDAVPVDLAFNLSSGTVSLPPGSMVANIDANLSTVTICVPSSAQIRVELENTWGGDNLHEVGLEERGSGWQTADYDTTPARVDLRVRSVLSSLTFQRPEVCT